MIGSNFVFLSFFSMMCNCTIPRIPLVINLVMWQNGKFEEDEEEETKIGFIYEENHTVSADDKM